MVKKFDLIVIGGGTAGLRTAFHSAKSGKKTAIIDPGILGGTCLNKGCIPTKAMLEAAQRYKNLNELEEFGISIKKKDLDFSKLMKRVWKIVNEGRSHVNESIKLKNLTVIIDKPKFISKNEISTRSGILTGEKFLISTGSSPRVLKIEGGTKTKYLMSEDAIHLKKLPKSIGIIGGGYIAMEFATFFQELGSKVTVLGREEKILPRIDPEISAMLTKKYKREGVRIITGVEAEEIGNNGKSKQITYKNLKGIRSKINVDEILVAIGRVPNTKDLCLEKANIKQGKRGEILINSSLETSNPRVLAAGDVTGKAMFAHSAKKESQIILNNLSSKKKRTMKFDLVPWAVFTNHPISGIGKSENDLIQEKIPYKALTSSFKNSGRTRINNGTEGILKVFYHKKTRKILGATMFGIHADELIHEFVALVSTSRKIDDLENIIHIHPTVSEIINALD